MDYYRRPKNRGDVQATEAVVSQSTKVAKTYSNTRRSIFTAMKRWQRGLLTRAGKQTA